MPHIHTEPGQHDHTASAVVIRIDGPEPRVMLHRHKKHGVYMQFGGHVELDETPWQTIQHELLEESGYELQQLTLLQPKDRIKSLPAVVLHPQPVCVNTHKFKEGHYHTDSIYALTTTEAPAHHIAEGESADFKLMTRQELIDLPADQKFPDVEQICLYMLDQCVPHWDRVDPKEYK